MPAGRAGPPPSTATLPGMLGNESLVAPAHSVHIREPLVLDCGRTLAGYTLSFETYGRLSPAADNAVLVCHSLTGTAHAAGRHGRADQRRGWWDGAIGPGRMIDTNRYFVICSDALAAGASTGPRQADPATGRPYGLSFPVITIRDMVTAQRGLLDCLGIARLHAVIGGCMGGQQALEWAIAQPEAVRSAVVITTTPATSAHSIAIFAVMRRLIRSDPAWNGGDYYDGQPPHRGLGDAITAAVPLWMSRAAMEARFGRRTADPAPGYSLGHEFAVEAFIEQLASRAHSEIDPNGLLYLTRAVEYFDLAAEYGGIDRAVAPVTASVLFVSYREDWRYPAAETEILHRALRDAGADSRHLVLDSAMGHGAFIYDLAGLAGPVGAFLAGQPAGAVTAGQASC
jgi:homoserine O-acetyltransferase